MRAAIRNGAAVINMSYGSRSLCRAEYNALQLAVRRGIVPVAAAGNEFDEGNPLEFPASLPHVLTIAAVNARPGQLGVLELQPGGRPQRAGRVDHDGGPAGLDGDGTQDGYQRLDGTSFSAPMVSGAVAWVRAARPDLSPDQVAQVIRLSARDLGRDGFDNNTGFGLLDVGAALAKAPPPRDPLEPNDDMVWVDGRGFGRAAPAVFAGRRTARLVGLVDAYEDPADVYRVRVRRRSTVRVIAKPVFGDPVLAALLLGHEVARALQPAPLHERAAAGDLAPQGLAHGAHHAAQPHAPHADVLRRARAPGRGPQPRRGLPAHDPALDGTHCSSARSPVPSSAAGVGTAGLSRRYHSASSAAMQPEPAAVIAWR